MNPKKPRRFRYTDLVPHCFHENQSFEGMVLLDPCTGMRCLKTRDPKTGEHRLLVDVDNVVLNLHRDGQFVRVTRVPQGLTVSQL
ncbi:hypothetical protein KKC88_01760 [Patescibacteria group bacterium]|nr:hypothetical protein [Patescibacteria group bacterium]MBU1673847.1 hypothetical protein [Patescibacteria group bacterium]MBU1963224.1 hypothetical protein [Patescibacteria group bacterium]